MASLKPQKRRMLQQKNINPLQGSTGSPNIYPTKNAAKEACILV